MKAATPVSTETAMFHLNTGRDLPVIGFGTWQLTPDEVAERTVLTALQAGYRVIDTACVYGNEAGVGAAIRESGIDRRELFITTKLWNNDHGYERTLIACHDSLERLGLDYLDLYLIHWPATSKRHDSWRALEKLYQDGHVKAAGVSNYTVRHLQELQERSRLIPAVNQVEFHPFIYRQQRELLAYCAEQGILIEAYSPLRRISHEEHGPILQIARKYGKTPQQIVLRWCVQHGTLPIARSLQAEHIRSNLAISDLELDDVDMRLLDSLSDGQRVTWDPGDMN